MTLTLEEAEVHSRGEGLARRLRGPMLMQTSAGTPSPWATCLGQCTHFYSSPKFLLVMVEMNLTKQQYKLKKERCSKASLYNTAEQGEG